MTPVLEARSLAKSFGARRVVDGVDLAVASGEVVGLLGPNGAGKTTVFRLVAGLLVADSGTVLLDGVDLSSWPLWRRARAGLGYLPQVPTVFRGITVAANVEIALEARGASRGAAAGVLDAAGLAHLASARAETLSGGERRRLEIARCLAQAPRVLLLDEPFAGLDPVAVADLTSRIRALAASGMGVLLTDHAVREAFGSCDRVVVLDHGILRCTGDPASVARDPHVRARYLGQDFPL
ncbi:MAG: LPS export ABC transporter ATP-binding protein [Deltaproteobacteria bacterium]|nr:LPS export ABC transporter ATP-binding protein [Deltaproteobacteria bacterium]